MAFDIFLKIKDIPGESSFAKHKAEIELESWSWGETNMSSKGGGGVDFSFTVRKRLDKSSPILFGRACTGENIPSAQLLAIKHGGSKGTDVQEYLQYTFSNVQVTNVFAKHNKDLPYEEISFVFQKIEFDYRIPKNDGSLGPLVHGECFEK